MKNVSFSSYLTPEMYIGSCVYDDICKIIENLYPESFHPTNCSPELAEYGIDCTCPFKIRSGPIDLIDILLDIPDFSMSNYLVYLFGSGDFDVTIKMEDLQGKLACLRIKYSIKPKPTM